MRLFTKPLPEQAEEKQRGINVVDLMMWLVIAALMIAAAIQSIGYYQKAAYLYQMNTEAEVVAGKVNAAASIDGSSVDLTLIKKIVDEENLAHPDSPMKLSYGSVSAYAAPSLGDTNYGFERSAAVTEVTPTSVNYIKAIHNAVSDREVVFLFNATANYKAGVNVIDTGTPAFPDDPTATSSASPSSSTSASPSPSSTATASPSATSTTTVSPAPTVTPSPTASATPTPTPTPTTVNWTAAPNAVTTNLYRIKATPDLTNIIAGGAGTIKSYLSTDGGTSWKQGSPDKSAITQGMGITRNGSKIISGCYASTCNMYISTDGGNTWTLNTAAGAGYWADFSISDDGSKIVASNMADTVGGISNSTDGGVTWTKRTTGGTGAVGLASTSDGKTVYAVNGSGLRVSTDYGTTWTTKTNVSGNFAGLYVSADGKYVTLGANGTNARVYTSSDYGVTFTPRTLGTKLNLQITSVASSEDGKRYIAVDSYNGEVWFSLDSGVTWQKAGLPTTTTWKSVVLNSDGTQFVVAGTNGTIYKGALG